MNCVDWVHHDSVTTANPKYPVEIVERIESKKPSNADRIRAMSDEELADWIWGAESDGRAYGPRGKYAWLDWLRQEALP